MLVRCLNCRMLWKYVGLSPGETTATEDVQTRCPRCGSNAHGAPDDPVTTNEGVWKLARCWAGDANKYLAEGWEPFAVTTRDEPGGSHNVVWLRGWVPMVTTEGRPDA